ncbi:hypothetical protein [Brevundimonas sp.]|uniref:hypothetical protein n=1 Tax=Brevundimonas sp. TaxID=1871086 RepID=UPI002ED795EE
MFGRLGRRRSESSGERPSERAETTTAIDDLLDLLRMIEAAAGAVYGRHGLPQRPGHYRRSADSHAWEPLGDALSPAEKWALIDAAPKGGRWRYAAHETLGAHSDIAAVRQASALLAACQGLRKRLADRAIISPQDLADSIRLGQAWRRLVEDGGQGAPAAAPLHFLPPDEG